MIVAACVATEKLTRLRDALPEPHRLHVALGRDGVEALVLHGIDDDEWQLRRVLESQPGVALAAQLIAAPSIIQWSSRRSVRRAARAERNAGPSAPTIPSRKARWRNAGFGDRGRRMGTRRSNGMGEG